MCALPAQGAHHPTAAPSLSCRASAVAARNRSFCLGIRAAGRTCGKPLAHYFVLRDSYAH